MEKNNLACLRTDAQHNSVMEWNEVCLQEGIKYELQSSIFEVRHARGSPSGTCLLRARQFILGNPKLLTQGWECMSNKGGEKKRNQHKIKRSELNLQRPYGFGKTTGADCGLFDLSRRTSTPHQPMTGPQHNHIKPFCFHCSLTYPLMKRHCCWRGVMKYIKI